MLETSTYLCRPQRLLLASGSTKVINKRNTIFFECQIVPPLLNKVKT